MPLLIPTPKASLPDAQITWLDSTGNVVPFVTGYTFVLRIGKNGVTVVTKNTGIVGANTAPNVTVSWADDELISLAPGFYDFQLTATLTATGKDRVLTDRLQVGAKALV